MKKKTNKPKELVPLDLDDNQRTCLYELLCAEIDYKTSEEAAAGGDTSEAEVAILRSIMDELESTIL